MPGRLLPLFAVATLVAGCNPSDHIPDLHPLTGTVTRDGQPVTGGGLIFVPESGGWGGVVVDANVNKDGTFAAQTCRVTGTGTVFKPGVKVGRYKVTFHPPSDGSKGGLESEVRAVVVVTATDNAVVLELPSKVPAGVGAERDDANPPELLDPKKDGEPKKGLEPKKD